MTVFIVVVAIVFAAIASWQAGERSRLVDAFRQIAHRHQGRLDPGGWFRQPVVHLRHGSARVKLDTFSSGGENPTHFTQLQIGWPDRRLDLEVLPETFFNKFGKLLGMQDIQIGSRTFDERYIIRGNNEHWIIERLTAGVQSTIDELRRFLGNDDVYIRARGGSLLIKKRELIRDGVLLERFVALSLELFDGLTSAGAEGIAFVEPPAGQDHAATEVICQICGEAIQGPAVYCQSCKTPHHKDCWDYVGKCSTYGCGQTQYGKPRHPRPPQGRQP